MAVQSTGTYDPVLLPCPMCGSRAMHVVTQTNYGVELDSICCENPSCGYTFNNGLNYIDMQTKWNEQASNFTKSVFAKSPY